MGRADSLMRVSQKQASTYFDNLPEFAPHGRLALSQDGPNGRGLVGDDHGELPCSQRHTGGADKPVRNFPFGRFQHLSLPSWGQVGPGLIACAERLATTWDTRQHWCPKNARASRGTGAGYQRLRDLGTLYREQNPKKQGKESQG